MTKEIRIAISGGGLAGASLIHALVKYPHLDAHIFESASSFREQGIAVGIARNALTALDLIGPSAVESLKRAGAVPQQGVLFKLADGQGSLIAEANARTEGKRLTSIVQRADFLRELLVDVSKERMHAGKKLVTIERPAGAEGPITLHFTDGTTHECDVLVGADGIHSRVRELILGENDSASHPRNTGFWVVMSLQPYGKVQEILGQDLVNSEDAREHSWIGNGQIAMHNLLGDGQLVQFVIGSSDSHAEGSDEWQRVVPADEMKNFFKDGPSFLSRAVKELLSNQPEQRGIYLWDHLPARTYASGPLCVMGDAAHATTPWQGSRAGMSVEDSLILSSLLGKARSSAEAIVALKVYDQVRRPRTQRIVESSRGTGEIVMGRGEEGLKLEWLRQNFLPRWDFIIDFDNEKDVQESLNLLDNELRGLNA